MKRFSDLSEQEVLALAVTNEEEDSRIYLGFADGLREQFPASAKVFEEMAEEEVHHRTILFDPDWSAAFWNAMWNNVKFFCLHMLLQNPIGLLLATLFSLKGLRGARTYRTLIFLPTLLSVVIIGFIWQLILSPLWGVAEKLLGLVGLADWFAPWLGQESTALVTLSLISVWQYVGIPMMLIYAALLAVPEEVLEAAHAEGASAMRIFWQIKLPLIYPTLGLVTILTFVANFNAFDLIYSVKGALAGPNYASDLLGTYHVVLRKKHIPGKGTFYGAQVGTFATREDATGLCSHLKSAGGNCLVEKN